MTPFDKATGLYRTDLSRLVETPQLPHPLDAMILCHFLSILSNTFSQSVKLSQAWWYRTVTQAASGG